MARKYEKVQEMLPVVRQLAEAGDTQQQIADKLGLNNAKVVRNLLWKEKKRMFKVSRGSEAVKRQKLFKSTNMKTNA